MKAGKKTFAYLLKKIIYAIGTIVMLSFFITTIGVLGYILTDRMPLEYLWIPPLIGGIFLYLIGYFVLRKLRRVEKVKSEFLTIAAHNLRTPLTKIQWLIANISEKIQEPEIRKRFESMEKTFKSLTVIVNRLLELSEAGKTSIYFSYLFEDHHLEYIVLQATADYNVGIEQKNISLNTRIQEGLPMVQIDRERMQLAVNILVENAILYNRENGTIDIDIYQKKDNIVCSIKNAGIGIAKEDLPKMFTKFYRTRDAIAKDTDRVGLGLALAREIIERHHGKIYVESNGRDRNTCFWFTLPVSKNKRG